MPSRPVVLDTHVWVWWMMKAPLAVAAIEAVDEAAARGGVFVPAISVWEVAMLVSRGRLVLSSPLHEWCARALDQPGFALAPLSPDVAIDSVTLPGELHLDPADRMIVATARCLDATLVTRDRKLLGYAADGHLLALAA